MVEEFYVFLGVVIMMGIVEKPHMNQYWLIDPLLHIPIFGKAMTRNWFQAIPSSLHFFDTTLPRETV